MGLIAGIDLHSNNGYLGIINDQDEVVFKKRLPNDLDVVLKTLDPFRKDLEAIAVESTYNWYWLVDGLMDNGFKVHLAHPSAIKQYEGLKHTDDEDDALFIALLLHLGILPEGYIYPKEDRPVRDLLRRRMSLVRQRTAHILSFQSLLARELGSSEAYDAIKKANPLNLHEFLGEEHLVLAGETNLAVTSFLTNLIANFEKVILKRAKLKPQYHKLLSVPGIGEIMALTITFETGDIGRFPSVGDYSSYCRAVKADRLSNGKRKGKGNQKNGNKYLGWAFVETANFCRRFCPQANRFFQRKCAKTNSILATKALANKLSKACYFIMRDQVDFDVDKLFA